MTSSAASTSPTSSSAHLSMHDSFGYGPGHGDWPHGSEDAIETSIITPESQRSSSPRVLLPQTTFHGRLHTANGLSGLPRYRNYLNLLLICALLGVMAHGLQLPDYVVFSLCFVGMIPMPMHLSRAAADVTIKTSDTVGAFVNVTCNNAVQIILCIVALRADRVTLVHGIVAGSMLSNLLFVLGSAFLWGGIHHLEQTVSASVSKLNSDMLAFSVFSLCIPAIFAATLPHDETRYIIENNFSLAESICLLALYFLYIMFQLRTDKYLCYRAGDAETGRVSPSPSHPLLMTTAPTPSEEPEEEDNTPSLLSSFTVLFITLVAVYALSELLLGCIDGFSWKTGLRIRFIATVLLPVIGNAVEHLSAIFVAGQNKIDVSIGIACGSSVQIAMFTAPSLVLISLIATTTTLTLILPTFETVVIAFSVYVVLLMLQDSMLNWVKGAILIMCYVMVASTFLYR